MESKKAKWIQIESKIGKMDSDRMQNSRIMIECKTDSIRIQNRLYHNAKYILLESEKAKRILIKCKIDSYSFFFFCSHIWLKHKIVNVFIFTLQSKMRILIFVKILVLKFYGNIDRNIDISGN